MVKQGKSFKQLIIDTTECFLIENTEFVKKLNLEKLDSFRKSTEILDDHEACKMYNLFLIIEIKNSTIKTSVEDDEIFLEKYFQKFLNRMPKSKNPYYEKLLKDKTANEKYELIMNDFVACQVLAVVLMNQLWVLENRMEF